MSFGNPPPCQKPAEQEVKASRVFNNTKENGHPQIRQVTSPLLRWGRASACFASICVQHCTPSAPRDRGDDITFLEACVDDVHPGEQVVHREEVFPRRPIRRRGGVCRPGLGAAPKWRAMSPLGKRIMEGSSLSMERTLESEMRTRGMDVSKHEPSGLSLNAMP